MERRMARSSSCCTRSLRGPRAVYLGIGNNICQRRVILALSMPHLACCLPHQSMEHRSEWFILAEAMYLCSMGINVATLARVLQINTMLALPTFPVEPHTYVQLLHSIRILYLSVDSSKLVLRRGAQRRLRRRRRRQGSHRH